MGFFEGLRMFLEGHRAMGGQAGNAGRART